MFHVPRDRISIFLLLNNIMSGEAICNKKLIGLAFIRHRVQAWL